MKLLEETFSCFLKDRLGDYWELYNCSSDQMQEETLALTLILLKWAMNLRNRLLSGWRAKMPLAESSYSSFLVGGKE